MPLPSGGWLRFRAETRTFKTLAPPPAGSDIPLYEMTVVVGEDADLHTPNPLRIKVTNAEQSLHPTSRKQIWELMGLRAEVKGIDEPMGVAEIESRIRLFARNWTNGTGEIGALYSTARYAYENEEITIPVINVQVSGSLALAALAFVSTAFAAYCSYQCRMAAPAGEGEPHAGFMILRPQVGTVQPGWWHHLFAQGGNPFCPAALLGGIGRACHLLGDPWHLPGRHHGLVAGLGAAALQPRLYLAAGPRHCGCDLEPPFPACPGGWPACGCDHRFLIKFVACRQDAPVLALAAVVVTVMPAWPMLSSHPTSPVRRPRPRAA